MQRFTTELSLTLARKPKLPTATASDQRSSRATGSADACEDARQLSTKDLIPRVRLNGKIAYLTFSLEMQSKIGFPSTRRSSHQELMVP
jgi:hypothetical protein